MATPLVLIFGTTRASLGGVMVSMFTHKSRFIPTLARAAPWSPSPNNSSLPVRVNHASPQIASAKSWKISLDSFAILTRIG